MSAGGQDLLEIVIEVRTDVRVIKDALPGMEGRLRSLEESRAEGRGERAIRAGWRGLLIPAGAGTLFGVLSRWLPFGPHHP